MPGDSLFAWVGKVNVRSAPRTTAGIVARVPDREPLYFQGRRSPEKTSVLLRAKVYHEPWLEVKTSSGQTGWVFGGAVKQPAEDKGNRPVSATRLDFPYFGRYNLNNWTLLEESSDSGGDVVTRRKRYQDGPRIMTVSVTDMGGYGYEYQWQLGDIEGHILLDRQLSLRADPEWVLTEKVVNHIAEPPTEHFRTQTLAVPPAVLGGHPLLVNAPWQHRSL